jgi:ATP-dependent exoDNAse (exonuclease V) beta subunit
MLPYPILKTNYSHPRDNNITFEEKEHKYTILTDNTSSYTSVTTFIHSHFPKFDPDKIIDKMMKSKSWKEGHKYWNKSSEEIKKEWSNNGSSVSQLGTSLHFQIECFMNNPDLIKGYTHIDLLNHYYETQSEKIPTKEWNYFIQFINDFPHLKPFRTEWTIYDEDLKLAGSIDMVYINPDDTLSIYDWKRVKNITKVNTFDKYAITESICHVPDTNFWHYAIQLNMYKTLLELKYNKKVTDLYLVRLHPDTEENSYELIAIPLLDREIQDLLKERRMNYLLKNA